MLNIWEDAGDIILVSTERPDVEDVRVVIRTGHHDPFSTAGTDDRADGVLIGGYHVVTPTPKTSFLSAISVGQLAGYVTLTT